MTNAPARPELVAAFRDLHVPGQPLLIPNPWDVGSARVLAHLGYAALATTSSGFAATLGRLDGTVSRDEALRHAADIAAATALPVSADLENGYADEPADVADLVRAAIGVGLAGCSIEDATGRSDDPIYEPRLASERVAAAAEAAHGGVHRLVLTARAENHLHGRDDLADTIDPTAALPAGRCGCPVRAGADPSGGHRGRGALGRSAGQRPRDAERAARRATRRPRCQPRVGRRIIRVRGARRSRRGGPGTTRPGHVRIRPPLGQRTRGRPRRVRRVALTARRRVSRCPAGAAP